MVSLTKTQRFWYLALVVAWSKWILSRFESLMLLSLKFLFHLTLWFLNCQSLAKYTGIVMKFYAYRELESSYWKPKALWRILNFDNGRKQIFRLEKIRRKCQNTDNSSCLFWYMLRFTTLSHGSKENKVQIHYLSCLGFSLVDENWLALWFTCCLWIYIIKANHMNLLSVLKVIY